MDAPRIIPLLLLSLVFALIIGAGLGYLVGSSQTDRQVITSFEECRAAGYPVMESYPEQCATPDGRTFTRDITSDDNVPLPEEPVFCTMDAKLCPDGSYVGRVGPRCEFAPCP